MTWRTIVLVVIGLLVLAGAVVAVLALSALPAAAQNTADMVFRRDAFGRYPNEPGYRDPDA